MLPTGLGPVLSLGVFVLVQVIAIVDFNISDDPKLDSQICCMVEHTFPQEPYRVCHEKQANGKMDNGTVKCIHECYYKAIGMFSADNKLQLNNYNKYRDELDPILQDAFSYSLAACTKIVAQLVRQHSTYLSNMRCSPVPFIFNRCLKEVGVLNCPPQRLMNSSFCDDYIKRLVGKYGPIAQYDPSRQNGTKGKDSS